MKGLTNTPIIIPSTVSDTHLAAARSLLILEFLQFDGASAIFFGGPSGLEVICLVIRALAAFSIALWWLFPPGITAVSFLVGFALGSLQTPLQIAQRN
jgi:hypothetical protein